MSEASAEDLYNKRYKAISNLLYDEGDETEEGLLNDYAG